MPGVRARGGGRSWYPGSAAALAAEVEGYLAAVPAVRLRAAWSRLISPHAGLRYSGPVAAHAYALLRGRRDLTVVLVGPSHRRPSTGSACSRTARSRRRWARSRSTKRGGGAAGVGSSFRDQPSLHRDEHSLEMQLPFLQHLVPGLRIVPVLMGSQSREEVDALAGALARTLEGRDALLVASSDLSHYHPAPVANELDARVVADVQRLDPEGLMDRLESYRGHACGGGPMVAVMKRRARAAPRRPPSCATPTAATCRTGTRAASSATWPPR